MKPGDYAVGSPQSRAAARALLERRFAGRIRRTIIVDLDTDCTEPRIGEWREGTDGSMGRVCALPDGMTMREAERIVVERRSVQGNATGPNRCVPNCVPRNALL
jgi:phosphoribosylformimino-5-aminoimidazole carboxamide ribonucleotide (ProFAR) isomerase